MKVDGISPPKKLDDNSYGFTAVFGGIIIPGFRTYMGKIQAPMKRNKSAWYPMLYLSDDIALSLYLEVKNQLPEGVLSDAAKATGDLIHDEAIAGRFGVTYK